MRLRTRLSDELKERLIGTLPSAVETVWDTVAVVVAIEQLKFTSAGGFEGTQGEWGRKAEIEGIVRAELRADAIDSLEVEPLISNLVGDTVFLDFDDATEIGALTERARIILADWRDTIRDQNVVSAMRFTVSGTLAERLDIPERPELLIGQAPEIGPGNEAKYQSVEDAA